MKKIFKYIKLLIVVIFINQILTLTFNNSIKKGSWKSVSHRQLNGRDFLEFDDNINLKWNIIYEKNKKIGVVQFYVGKKY